MPEIIDATSHIMPEAALDELERVLPSEEAASLRNAPRMFEVDGRIDYLDRHGIDRQVVNLAAPMVFRGADPDEVLQAVRIANDGMAEIADRYPDRFVPTGTVPFLTGEYVDEARRCVDELGFRGLQTFTNVGGKLLDHEDHEPFWAELDDLDVPLWIHPQLNDWHDWGAGETWIYKMLGWPFETSVTIARLIFFGVMERHGNVEIVSHHLGGSLPYLVGRLRSWYQTRREEPELYDDPKMTDLSAPLDAYLDRVYGDTAVSSHGETYPLRCGYEFFGPDNVVYSADYPFGPEKGEYWAETIVPAIDELDIPEENKEKIFSGNVKRLLDL